MNSGKGQMAMAKPAVTRNSRRLTDKQRAIVEMRKTATVRETAERFDVPTSQVTWAESIFHWNMKGEAMLAADPESLEGLSLTGAISNGLARCLTGFCGSDEELQGVPDHEDYERVSDVLRAGSKAVRHHWALGPARWAEWLAFMQSRGLEWGKPLSEAPNAPAKPMVDGWNIIDFPTGRARLETMTHNTAIRARWCTLSREIGNFQSLLIEATGEKNRFNRHINAMIDGMNGLFDELVSRRILAEEEPS
jgi:hypothetical protein